MGNIYCPRTVQSVRMDTFTTVKSCSLNTVKRDLNDSD